MIKKTSLFIGMLFLLSFIDSKRKLPPTFVYVQDIIPTIKLDIRYAKTTNFTGKKVTGYLAEKCILTKQTALQLEKIEAELAQNGFCLQIYDGYRPQKAVGNFVKWARDISDTLMKSQYYPKVKKRNLFKEGYIASKSRHSSGSTVDLTIFSDAKNSVLDMGSSYDYFGKESWVNYQNLSKKQKANRIFLQRIMQKYGFRSYPKEWWHFTLKGEPYRNHYFNFDVY